MNWHFSYSVSRSFPFRYFTILVAVVFIVATVLFSLFNTIVSGYELSISYSTSPNATMEKKLWYDRPGFAGIKKLKPRCESKELGQQQIFHTNKYGLLYTINTVEQLGTSTGDITLPSLVYLNNPLENCSVNYIRLELQMDSRTSQQISWSRWGPSLQAAVSCFTETNLGLMRLNTTVSYDLVPPSTAHPMNDPIWAGAATYGLLRFVKGDNRNDSAMWWSESLMSYSWVTVARAMEDYDLVLKANDGGIEKSTLNFFPNETHISSPNFFIMQWYHLLTAGNFYVGTANYSKAPDKADLEQDLYRKADDLAKAFHSTISIDLGMLKASNIITNATALSAAFTSFNQTDLEKYANVPCGPAVLNTTVEKQAEALGTPNVTTSMIFTNYLCQLPVAKVPASLIVSVLLADLVFLRALWTIVALVAIWWAGKKYDRVDWCAGCLASTQVASTKKHLLAGDEGWEMSETVAPRYEGAAKGQVYTRIGQAHGTSPSGNSPY
ncbi:hypothetical protein EJ04DRAFT_475616 [Polyplosphaeria fusca]|uniref:Uncharacterized protein n=1 Tax=Polyplosphaeria fusca TaxID=682080 RepID=A0A9P4UYP7_9PLEO|nr:hypothetical protein EJ04DRAFT_475616 [Polyplosphaeria fusca]